MFVYVWVGLGFFLSLLIYDAINMFFHANINAIYMHHFLLHRQQVATTKTLYLNCISIYDYRMGVAHVFSTKL